MKAKVRVSGTDGNDHYDKDATVDRDSEWLRKLLANGLAEPLDEQARDLCEDPAQIERYRSETFTALAARKGVPDTHIPSVAHKGA